MMHCTMKIKERLLCTCSQPINIIWTSPLYQGLFENTAKYADELQWSQLDRHSMYVIMNHACRAGLCSNHLLQQLNVIQLMYPILSWCHSTVAANVCVNEIHRTRRDYAYVIADETLCRVLAVRQLNIRSSRVKQKMIMRKTESKGKLLQCLSRVRANWFNYSVSTSSTF